MRPFIRRVALSAAALIAGLAAMELACRGLEARLGRYYYCDYNLGPRQWAIMTFRPSSRLGWEHVPGVQGFDSRGLANPEYPDIKAPGVYRIVLAGDSLAENYGGALREVLERGSAGRRMELWDLGVGSYNIAQVASMLEERGMARRPDLVVLFLSLRELNPYVPTLFNDGNRLVSLRWWGTSPLPVAFGPLWDHCAAYRLLVLRRLDRSMRGGSQLPMPRRFGQENLARIGDLCRRNGVPLAVFLFPYLEPLSEYTPDQRAQYEDWKAALAASGLDYVDLQPRLDGRWMLAHRESSGDYIHLDEEGRRRTMRLVYDVLKSMFKTNPKPDR